MRAPEQEKSRALVTIFMKNKHNHSKLCATNEVRVNYINATMQKPDAGNHLNKGIIASLDSAGLHKIHCNIEKRNQKRVA